ncbi:protein indeterminate-domain 5, chloroplastic isoform X1 [Musa acuminata AAA Group]|uniref:protein indeterminate-domain 5, chloroplastic isoform X1 n=1 Tax=Musa acuminata AAA Group TaxID=214697 RepID=UPI0031E0EF88
MASASSSSPFLGVRGEELHSEMKQQQKQPSSAPPPPATKKRRNQPGNPTDPDAEVIALSPKTLLATNRFICEVCNKGFQREQNLQLHRRGHNLPWKLRLKSSKEVRRRVYLCPEPTCVHHDPSRALGDLTGIKKHFCRKHGEKKWKCDKCSKRYAVQSDLKAHSKTCGTREYRCDCGTLFSRRDSFITHRAFCNALAQERSRLPTAGLNNLGSHLYGNNTMALSLSQVSAQLSSLPDHRGSGSQFEHLVSAGNPSPFPPPQLPPQAAFYPGNNGSNQDFSEEHQPHHSLLHSKAFHGLMQLPDLQGNTEASSSTAAANLFNLSFFSNNSSARSIGDGNNDGNQNNQILIANDFNGVNGSSEPTTLFNGDLMSDHVGGEMNSLYNTSMQNESILPRMSATALLHKAAQMGLTTCGGSSLSRGFGSSISGSLKPPSLGGGMGGGDGNGEDGLQAQMENEAHLQNLMNSLANGSSSLFVCTGGVAALGGSCTTGGLGSFAAGLRDADETKFSLSSSGSLGVSDRLTRDFLGVGGMVRSISGGISRREQNHGIGMNALDPK